MQTVSVELPTLNKYKYKYNTIQLPLSLYKFDSGINTVDQSKNIKF